MAFPFWDNNVYTDSNGKLQCPGFTGETYAKAEWDRCSLGGVQLPGIVDVQVTSARDVDKKKAAGNDGARITLHGYDPAQVEIRLTIWTPAQLKVLNDNWSQFFPKANKTPPKTGFDIQHPKCSLHGIKSVVVIGASGPDPGSTPRSRVFTIRCLEFVQPGKQSKTASPVESKGSKFDKPTVNTPGSNPKNTGPKRAKAA